MRAGYERYAGGQIKKNKEGREETDVYLRDSSCACLSILAKGQEGVYIKNTKSLCQLSNLWESFREFA